MQAIDDTGALQPGPRALPYVLAAIATIAGLLVLQPYAVGVYHDDGAYAILARSIAEGRGFRFLQLPGDPAAIHYPPAYPLTLAMLWRVAPSFPSNVTTLLAANALFLGVVALGVHRLCVRTLGWSEPQAAVASLVSTLSYPLLLLTGILLSESMFIAGLMLLLPVGDRLLGGMRGRSWLLSFGVACGALALVRTHGLALVAAVVLLLMWRRRWRDAGWCVAGVMIPLLPWQIWQAAHDGDLPAALSGSYGSYASWFFEGVTSAGFFSRTLGSNAREIWSTLADRFSPADASIVKHFAAAAALLAIIYGGWSASRRAPVMAWCALIYMAIVMIWPYSPWRFVFAIWPLVIVFLGESARVAWSKARARQPIGVLTLAALGVIGVGIVTRETRAAIGRSWWVPARVAAQQTVPGMMWVVRNTSETSVVASEVPELVYLYTGRRSVPVMPFTAAEYGVARSRELDRSNVEKTIRQLPVDYVVTISPPMRDAVKAMTPSPRLLDSAATYAAFRIPR